MKLGEVINIGSSIGSIETLSKIKSLEKLEQKNGEGESFGDILQKSIGEVNKTQVKGYNAMAEIATGKVENLQQAVQKIEEAEISLKLALEIKNKALSAYKEISRMQV